MKNKTRNLLTSAVTAAILVLALLLSLFAASCDTQPEMGAQPPDQTSAGPEDMSFAVGDTSFVNLVTSGDITAGDDLTVTDDATITGAATVGETLAVTGATSGAALTLTGIATLPIDVEHIGALTLDSATIITTTDGAVWTVGATELWYIERVFCNVTTNFDCTGDDCTIEIGLTGGDIDGFLDLDDAELQAADTEIAGLPAGWQGFGSTDTRGAFFAAGSGVMMTNDTIDIKIEDTSATTDPTAGAATCYVLYYRFQ